MSQTTNRRKTYIVNPAYQYGLTARIGLLAIAGIIISVFSCFLIAQNTMSLLVLKYNIPIKDSFNAFIFDNLPVTVSYLALMTLLLLLLILLIIRYTHRIVGPIIRLENAVQEMRKGNLDIHIRLRSKDCADSLAGALNALASEHSELIEGLRENIAKIKTKVETMGDKSEGPHNDLEDIKREVASIEKRLMFFETAKK
jgi:methyl-accepting chemotaxis protein